MKCKILHESGRRMRIHIFKPYMSCEEADILEFFLQGQEGVSHATVDERTGNAVVHFREEITKETGDECGSSSAREKLQKRLAEFDFSSEEAVVPDHSGRVLTRQYEDKMFFHIARRLLMRFVVPMPLRTVLTAVRSVPYLGKAAKSLVKGKLEVSVLDAASISVSMLRGEFQTAGSIMFLLGIGDIMEEWTHRKSVEDLAAAMALNAEKVWIRTEEGKEVLLDISQVHAGDTMVIRTGNLIPLDGVVLEGDGMVNQASITGEPLPVHKASGSMIYAGTVVDEGELAVTVREEAGSGRYDRIIRMIEESEKLKSLTEDKASHLADRLVPWTFGATALTWLLTRSSARAASILMVDFCCALKLSMPIAVLSAMREAGMHHIAVKGGKFMENCAEAVTIVFDKTGTLTDAAPSVKDVVTFNGSNEDEMLRLAACLEEHYPHSMANAVVSEAVRRSLEHEEKHSRVEYVVAHGIASSIDEKKVCIGSYHFVFEDEGCVIPEEEQERFDALPDEYSHLYLAIDGILCAVILIEDPLKKEAAGVIRLLHQEGISRVVMLTGDSDRTARAVAARVGVDDYRSEVLPEDKAEFIREEHNAGRMVIMVGDGVNDSPALSEADCGVAINSGAAIAREIADVTISEDDLHSLVTLRRISSVLMTRIHRNYTAILSINSVLILLGVLGILPSTGTALLHNVSTIGISMRSMTDLLEENGKQK